MARNRIGKTDLGDRLGTIAISNVQNHDRNKPKTARENANAREHRRPGLNEGRRIMSNRHECESGPRDLSPRPRC